MNPKSLKRAAQDVSHILFHHTRLAMDHHVFAVLDGASNPDLVYRLYEHQPPHVCLYRGELEPDLAECAPYLVQLSPNTPFTDWIITEGWGRHCGIFAITDADLRSLRKHFRTFLMVKNPDGDPIYFRYYDPRVLGLYLPTCTIGELRHVFGPVRRYLCEGNRGQKLLTFDVLRNVLRTEMIGLV